MSPAPEPHDLRDALARLTSDPFDVGDGPPETPEEVFAVDKPEKPVSATAEREAEIRRRVAAGFSAYHRRQAEKGKP